MLAHAGAQGAARVLDGGQHTVPVDAGHKAPGGREPGHMLDPKIVVPGPRFGARDIPRTKETADLGQCGHALAVRHAHRVG